MFIAIRGATTVDNDVSQEIKVAVKNLLDEIWAKNSLHGKNVTAIIFSNTCDLHSYYPAKAAREAGYFSAPLFSAAEPDIYGALPKCIRVMILAESSEKPVHVYQGKAVSLRKDITAKLNVAIDGPAGSGKSTVASLLAEKLNVLHLDTGATYRACALACVRAGVDFKDEKGVKEALSRACISISYSGGAQHTYLDGEDVTAFLRTPEISMGASDVSVYQYVRNKMVDLQRAFAEKNSCVLDGRDIGTNVLPAAEFKFFLTASPEVRAERRMKENALKGIEQPFDEVLKEIQERDFQDKNRKFAPLKQAEDAILVDTDNLTVEEVLAVVEKYIQVKI